MEYRTTTFFIRVAGMLAFILVLLSTVVSKGQISGPATVETGSTHTYTYTGSVPVTPTWSVNGGTKVSSTSTTVTVRWNSAPGMGMILYKMKYTILADKGVMVAAPPAPPSVNGPSVCDYGSMTLIASSPEYGATFRWYDALGSFLATGSSYTTPVLYSTTSYYVSVESEMGLVSDRKHVYATVRATPSAPSTVESSYSSCGSSSFIIVPDELYGGPSYIYRWYDQQYGGNLIATTNDSYSTGVINSSTTFYFSRTLEGATCESERTAVHVAIKSVPSTVPDAEAVNRCGIGDITLTATGGSVFSWYDVPEGGESLGSTGSLYISSLSTTSSFFVALNNDGCDGPRKEVVAAVLEVPQPPSTVDQELCGGGVYNLAASGAPSGGDYKWYTTSTGGVAVHAGSSYSPELASSTTFWVASVSGAGCESTSRDMVSAIVLEKPPVPDVVDERACGAASFVLEALTQPGDPTYTYSWYEDDAVSTPVTTGVFFNTPLITSGRSYFVSRYDGTCESDRSEVVISIDPLSTLVPDGDDVSRYGPGSVTLTAHSGPNGYRWYSASTGGTLIGTSNTVLLDGLTETKSCFVTALNEFGCEGLRAEIRAIVLDASSFEVVVNGSKTLPGHTVLSVPGDHYEYQWMRNGVALTGEQSPTCKITDPGSYCVKIRPEANSPFDFATPPVTISHLLEQNQNLVLSIDILEEGLKTPLALNELAEDAIVRKIVYYDDLGRRSQEVSAGLSPNGNDFVQPVAYDAYGRQSKVYLPFTTSGNSGTYVSNALTDQNGQYTGSSQYVFYQNTASVAHDERPFSETFFELCPLNRVLKTGGPGVAWKPSGDAMSTNDKTEKKRYDTNTEADNVIRWRYDVANRTISAETAGGVDYYAPQTLRVTRTYDAHNNLVITYQNFEEQIILKRVQAELQSPINSQNFASTYYIYDELGNLCVVLSPEASARITDEYLNETDVSDRDDFLSRWAFRYEYDEHRRMITKQVPGAKAIYMVYDGRDRLVMTQDGNQRTSSPQQWRFTKYDALNRPVMTGLFEDLQNLDRQGMQDAVNLFYGNAEPEEWYEEGGNEVHGYTNRSFPSAGADDDYLTVTYYDDYTFKSAILGDPYDYVVDELDGQPDFFADPVRGHVTGKKTRIIGESEFLWNVTYYDDKYRVIQDVSTNALGNIDRTTNAVDFTGRVRATKSVHNAGLASEQVIVLKYDYDVAGRRIKTWHSVNGASFVLIAMNTYNEVGQLRTKRLHNSDPPSTMDDQRLFGENLDYQYNIRGWITDINNVDEAQSTSLFSMGLSYEEPGLNGGTAQFNGNISEVTWRSADGGRKSYVFTYDNMNRLVEANFYHADRPTENGRYNESIRDLQGNSGYDLNGNIHSLYRAGDAGIDGFGTPLYGVIDILDYDYEGNQLMTVTDEGAESYGFIDGADASEDYAYDDNGNLQIDRNKGIDNSMTISGESRIEYNHLNLPSRVVKNTGEYVAYTYDATSVKLRQVLFKPDIGVAKTTVYAGAFIYENDTLKFINHDEGRVVMTGSEPAYQYHLKDHLGNVRVTFTTAEEIDESLATLETSEQTNELGEFIHYDEAIKVDYALFDHTYDGTTGVTHYSTRLTGGNTNAVYGLAKSLSVMSGDTINMEVYAKYLDPDSENWTPALASFMAALAGGTAPPGTIIDGGGAGSVGSGGFLYADFFNRGDEGGSAPKAYLNFIVFDRDFQPIIEESGYIRISTVAKEDGTNIDHEKLARPTPLVIKEPGYVYIYLSNESHEPVEVYFDDFRVEHIKSSVVQMDDYYPFGLTFNSYQRENSVDQRWKFQGQEHIDDLGLNWDSFKWRNHQPDIGRFFNIDPLAEKYVYNSPYAFSENHVVAHRELEGLEKVLAIFYHGGPFGGGNTTTPEKAGTTGEIYKSTQAFSQSEGREFAGTVIAPGLTSASGVETGQEFVNANYAEGDQVMIYGYSYGVDNAMDLATSLGEQGITVNTLVTVDGSDGPLQNSTVNTTVPDNVSNNLNIYQTNDSNVSSSSASTGATSSNSSSGSSSSNSGTLNSPGSNGGPNRPTPGNQNKVIENRNVAGPGVNHGNIQQKQQSTIQNHINNRVHNYYIPIN